MPPQPYEHTDRGQRSTQKQLDEYGTTSPKYGIGGSSSGTGERAESDLLTQLRNRASAGVPKGKELSASDRQQRALEEEARTSAKQVKQSRVEIE